MPAETRERELSAEAREAVRDLIIVLADSKRLLGLRYADWMLGAPELETGIACSSMAQDEWGHARLLYSLVKDFGEDPARLEHEREGPDYRNIELLDGAASSWPELVALNALVDTALTVQLEALGASTYAPLRQRVQKVLEEEQFHTAHAMAWCRRMARSEQARDALREAFEAAAPVVLRWFGPEDGRAGVLADAGVVDAGGDALRARFLARVAGMLELVGLAGRWADERPDFEGFDDAARRAGGAGPDEQTLAQVRGDKNRAFLMD